MGRDADVEKAMAWSLRVGCRWRVVEKAAAKMRSHRHVCAMPACRTLPFGGKQGPVGAERVGEEVRSSALTAMWFRSHNPCNVRK